MRAKRKGFGGWVSKLLIASILATPISFFSLTSPAMAEDPPGSINLANASNGNSSLSTTLAESPGTGDLTYEFWYKQVNDSSNQVIFSTQSTPNSNDGFEFRKNYGNIEVWSGGNYLGGSGIDYMNLNQWIHFVIMRVGPSNWIIYRSGACRAYFQLSTTTSTKLTLGADDQSSFRGNIANFRYAKSALYTDPKFPNFLKNEPRFTPPLTPHSATPETKVLLNTVQGVNFAVDTSASPNTFTLSAAFPPTSSTDTPLPIFAKFEPNGGTGSMSNQVSNVSANLSSNSYTKSGSTFYGWNTEANGTGTFYKNGASYGFTSSITLHAQWSSNSVAVNFNSDGGSAVPASSVVIGSAITSAPTTPTKSGYTFGGWKPTAGGSAVTFPYYPVLTRTYASSVTAAALVDLGRYEHKGLWLSNIWYGPNRGTSPSSTRDYVTYTDGAKYVAIRESNNSVIGNPPQMDGYYLVPLDTSTTLTAIWSANSNTVTYDLNGGSSSLPTQADVVTAGTFTTAATPERAGYSFVGWSDGVANTGASTSYTMGAANITLTAQWSALPHTITYDLEGGSGSTPTQADVVTAGTFTTATTPVRTYWTFNGWSDGATTTPASTLYTVGTQNVTLTALWTRDTSSVTFDSQNWQSATIVSTLQGVAAAAPTDPTWYGYNFKGWSETTNGALVDVSTITITGPKTFYAIWEQKSLAGLTNLSSPDILNPHANFDRTVTTNYGNTTTSVKVPGGALPSTFQVRVYTVEDNNFASRALGAGTYIISQVIAWSDTAVATFGNIQDTAAGKPIEMTITSPLITQGAKVYALLGNSSRVLGVATQNGTVTVTFSEDPVIVVEAAPPVIEGSDPITSNPPSILAATGAAPSRFLPLAGGMTLLILLGFGLLIVARRRSKQDF